MHCADWKLPAEERKLTGLKEHARSLGSFEVLFC